MINKSDVFKMMLNTFMRLKQKTKQLKSSF